MTPFEPKPQGDWESGALKLRIASGDPCDVAGPGGFISTLFVRRADAWGVAVVIAALPLVLHQSVTPRNLLLLSVIALLYWLGYTANDYADAPFDAQDTVKARENFFVHHRVPRPLAIFTLVTSGIFLPSVFSLFGLEGIALLALAIVAIWGYSLPPLRFKSRPGIDLLAHGLFVQTFPYFICLVLIDVVWTSLDYFLLAINFLTSLSGQLRQQIRDFEVDVRTDCNFTTTVGVDASIFFLKVTTLCAVAVIGAGLWEGIVPLVIVPLLVLALPMAVHRLFVRPGERPSKLFNVLVMVALGYVTVLIVDSFRA